MAHAIDVLATWLFGNIVMWLLLITGLFLTVRLTFVQLRRFGEALKTIFPRSSEGSGGVLSPFQAFMTALGASIGTGNIAGVAAAIISGGPGALFWIWVYGFVAMAIKFSEAVLGVRFRQTDNQTTMSGPMYYLRDGLKSPSLAWIYAFVAGVAALTTTPFTQPNSIALAMNHVFPSGTLELPFLGVVNRTAIVTGLVVGVLTWAVIIRGITSIGRVAEKLAPLKVALYLIGGLVVIGTFASRVPTVLSMVVHDAFAAKSALGFSLFIAMRYGIARGIYANEAGYGTAAVAYGTAKSRQPTQQGLNAIMEVFVVSFVTSTISALTILLSGVAEQSIAITHAGGTGVTSSAAVASAFNLAMPTIGGWTVAFCAFLFGLTTLTGWAYYGEQFLEYVFGRRVTLPYRWIYCLLIPFGAVLKPTLVWAWGDLMNALQVFPNVIGLVGLSGMVAMYAKRRTEHPAPGTPHPAPRTEH
jgi:AGCS family alanine or glycine:cation symporter